MDLFKSIGSDTFFSYDEVVVEDEFERRRFSDRLARTIINEVGGKPLVVSIVNPWGGGKSTILQYIRDAFAATTRDESPQITNCRITTFNPWRYAGEDQLLYHLFEHLVAAINEKDLLTTTQTVWKLLPKWVKRGALVCDWFVPGTGALLDGFFATISPEQFEVHLDTVRQTTRVYLAKTGIRVIMLLDDVDRLDPDEMLLLFRALKLIVDLPNTTFIIAMDEEHVSGVIGQRIGGDIESGRRYIEKIVNVRLSVPKIPDDVLEDYVMRRFITIWQRERGEAPPMEVERMSGIFRVLHLPHILTPRTVKSIENAFAFALGLLPDEVDVGDVLLLEATRLLHPKLYLALPEVIPNLDNIRPDPIESMMDEGKTSEREREEKSAVVKKLRKLVQISPFRPRKQIEEAIMDWFPQLRAFFFEGEEKRNEASKRINSPNYFWRYYSGAVHKRDVHDVEVSTWLSLAVNNENKRRAAEDLRRHIRQPYINAFFNKLEALLLAKKGDGISALTLIAEVVSTFPESAENDSSANVWQKAASILSTVIRQAGDLEQQIDMATKVIQASNSLQWSFVFYNYIATRDYLTLRDKDDEKALITSKFDEELALESLNAYEAGVVPESNDLIWKMVWSIYRNAHLPNLKERVQKITQAHATALQFLVGGCAFGSSESHKPACWRWNGDKSLGSVEKLIPIKSLKLILKDVPSKPEGYVYSDSDFEYLTLEEVGWACLDSIREREAKDNLV